LSFLFLYRFAVLAFLYSTDKDALSERYNTDIWLLGVGIPLLYLLQWFLATWVSSKQPREELKRKFSAHPMATSVCLVLFLCDLPYRLAEYGDGIGIYRIVNIFEAVVYYAYLSFLWWLLLCWICSKAYRGQRLRWNWYKIAVDKAFVAVPIVYKGALGLIVAVLLSMILFALGTVVFTYTGQDLKALGQ